MSGKRHTLDYCIEYEQKLFNKPTHFLHFDK